MERVGGARGRRWGGGSRSTGRGSKTLATVEMGRAASWWPRDVELCPGVRRGGAGVGRGPGGGDDGAPGKRLGSLTTSGGRRERPTLVHPSARAYIPRTICRGGP